jgi:hypothetical protein
MSTASGSKKAAKKTTDLQPKAEETTRKHERKFKKESPPKKFRKFSLKQKEESSDTDHSMDLTPTSPTISKSPTLQEFITISSDDEKDVKNIKLIREKIETKVEERLFSSTPNHIFELLKFVNETQETSSQTLTPQVEQELSHEEIPPTIEELTQSEILRTVKVKSQHKTPKRAVAKERIFKGYHTVLEPEMKDKDEILKAENIGIQVIIRKKTGDVDQLRFFYITKPEKERDEPKYYLIRTFEEIESFVDNLCELFPNSPNTTELINEDIHKRVCDLLLLIKEEKKYQPKSHVYDETIRANFYIHFGLNDPRRIQKKSQSPKNTKKNALPESQSPIGLQRIINPLLPRTFLNRVFYSGNYHLFDAKLTLHLQIFQKIKNEIEQIIQNRRDDPIFPIIEYIELQNNEIKIKGDDSQLNVSDVDKRQIFAFLDQFHQ